MLLYPFLLGCWDPEQFYLLTQEVCYFTIRVTIDHDVVRKLSVHAFVTGIINAGYSSDVVDVNLSDTQK